MMVYSIEVQHFRSLKHVAVSCDQLTALVGRNGSGKSSVLAALELFYDSSAEISQEDFYNRDVSVDIQIAVTFANVPEAASDAFSAYLDQGMLTVVRVFSLRDDLASGRYHGMRLQNPEFKPVRQASGKREVVVAYSALRSEERYSELPQARSADAAFAGMEAWEKAHHLQCQRDLDEGEFFNFRAGQGNLGRFTRFLRIPPVRDAVGDAVEGRGSTISEIMDLVVRHALAERDDIAALNARVQADYRKTLDPSKLVELASLETSLSETLVEYAPGASVSLRWGDLPEIDLPMPTAEVRLTEDGYESPVDRTGHGLQRAFIVTMLQNLVAARNRADRTDVDGHGDSANVPDHLMLAVEEPELYLHPTRQRHMASVLKQLAGGAIAGAAAQVQVVYTTHSPQFVGLDRFDQVRLVRKVRNTDALPKATIVTAVALQDIAHQLWDLNGKPGEPYSADTLRPRLQAVMSSAVNEGFFADLVVLVEGEGDRAVIIAVAETMLLNLDSYGIAVITCDGKASMDRPALVFRNLGIATYVIWDNDKTGKDPKPAENRRLLRLVGASEEDWPKGVMNTYACMDGNVESVLRQELTAAVFDKLLETVADELHVKRRDAVKSPFVLREVVERAAKGGDWSTTLQNVVERLLAIRGAQA